MTTWTSWASRPRVSRETRRLPEAGRKRIHDLRLQGRSFGSIARELNSDGVPTAQSGRAWYPSTVRAVQLTT
jgi:hypothetical protein